MQQQIPLTRDVVLVGGGHTHALVLRRWGMKPLPGARLTLISPDPHATYSGMLPGHIAGHYDRSSLDIDLIRLSRFAGARLILGRASALDRTSKTITVEGRNPVRFDLASLDIGVSSAMPDLPGFSENAVPAKPLGDFAARWEDQVRASMDRGSADIVVIGGGVAGTELVLAMAHRLRTVGVQAARLTLIDSGSALSGVGNRARTILLSRLQDAGVAVMENSTISEVTPDAVLLAEGNAIPCAFCTGAAGAHPQRWLAASGLHLTDGFVTVREDLRTTGGEDIYAVGDCAHMAASPRPKAGVFAVRQAPVLYDNLRADLTGAARRRYKPQADYLKLVSLGKKSALADKAGGVTAAGWLWRVKDRIDRRFMDRFNDLPKMPVPALPQEMADGVAEQLADARPLCGGCGAKVGPGTLLAVLSDLKSPRRADVLSAPGDDAAILDMNGTLQVLTTDHLRAVVEDPDLMARIAATHALGDIWAMGAKPQAALSTLILPRMSAELQHATLAEISRAAGEVMTAAGAELVGGHTTLGAELTIGFTVTGLCDRAPLTLSGAQPGDALVLTKRLGSGILLAAEMTGDADGGWVANLWDGMLRSSGPAAERMARCANAMTDVTGFGLAGHLLGMADASGVGCAVDLDAIPIYPGALSLARRGIRSSLYQGNAAHVRPRMSGFEDGPETDLLLDPQTCGGLLASVPASEVDALVNDLAKTPTPATVIGTVEDAPPTLRRL